jgi:hypothetical protein
MSTRNPALRPNNQALTSQEMMFVERYLLHLNAAQAAREAGYCIEHPNSAHTAAYEILHKPYIRNAIDNRMQMICMETNEALVRLAAIARGDMLDFMSRNDETGQWYLDLDKAKESGKSFLIKSYYETKEGPRLELYSAQEALTLICKHLNIIKPAETEVNLSLSAWAIFVQKAKEESGIDLNAPLLSDGSVVDGQFKESSNENSNAQ